MVRNANTTYSSTIRISCSSMRAPCFLMRSFLVGMLLSCL
ncbi:hypothetical protein M3J09_004573 [Ascochyta lentis]